MKDIRDKAVAMAHYAVMAKDTELSRHATEIRLRAERRLGELMADMPKAKPPGHNQHSKEDRVSNKPEAPPTLEQQGIDKNLAHRARKAAAMPEDKYEAKIARQVNLAEKAASVTGKAAYPRAEFTGEFEWYTPSEYIEMAREAMGGIDLDPASSDKAQETVKATRYYTAVDDGSSLEWHGRVWLNPPYARGQIEQFIEKLVDEYTSGRVQSAILLTNNSTDTAWFRTAQEACSALCFADTRIRFYNTDGEHSSPTQGQSFFYFGDDVDAFADVFESVGFIMMPRKRRAVGKAWGNQVPPSKVETLTVSDPPRSWQIIAITKDGQRWTNGVRLETEAEADVYRMLQNRPFWNDFELDKTLISPRHVLVGTEAIPTNDEPNMHLKRNRKGRLSDQIMFEHGSCGLLGWNPIAEGSVLALPAQQPMTEAAE